MLTSITDEHFRGWTRLPAFGRVPRGGLWTAAFALASGEPVYGLGEKFGPLDKRGQLIHSQVEDALGVNTGLALQEHAVRVGPGHGQRRLGHVRAHAGHGDARRRPSGLVASQLRGRRRRRGARPLPLRRRHAGGHPRRVHATHRARAAPCRAGASGCGSRARYYKTPDEAIAVARKLRERRIPCDVLTLDGRAGLGRRRRASTSSGIPSASRIRAASLARDPRAPPARLRVGVPVRVDPRELFQQLAQRGYLLKTAERRSLRVRLGHVAGNRARSATC